MKTLGKMRSRLFERLWQNKTYWKPYLGSLIWNGVIDDISMYISYKVINCFIVIFWCIVKIFKECYISVLLSSRKNEILPDIHDIEGAARGIAKLWDRYRLVF